MPSTIQSLAPIKLGSTVYPCRSVSLPIGIKEQVIQHSGNIFPGLLGVPGADPKITLKMPFATAFAALGFGANSFSTVELTLATWASFARNTGSSHTKLALAASATAYCHIAGWSVSEDGWLMADIELWLMAPDSVTFPLAALNTSSALPTLVSQPAIHTMGPMSINGTVYEGLISAGGSLGNKFQPLRADGNMYPMIGGLMEGAPRMTGSHSDPTLLLGTAFGSYLGANITANAIQYFRAFDPTTGLVSNTNGVSITCASGRVHPKDLGAEQGELAKLGLEVIGLSTTSTHPFAVSLAASVPNDS